MIALNGSVTGFQSKPNGKQNKRTRIEWSLIGRSDGDSPVIIILRISGASGHQNHYVPHKPAQS